TAEEARLIIAKRLTHDGGNEPLGDASRHFGPRFHEGFCGVSTPRLLGLAQARPRGGMGREPAPSPEKPTGLTSAAARPLGLWRTRAGGVRRGRSRDRFSRPVAALRGAVGSGDPSR